MESDNQIILTVAKDLLVKAMENPDNVKLSLQSGEAAISDLGERFKILVKKVKEAIKD